MKVIIAGSRGITDYGWLLRALGKAAFNITEVVSGMESTGVDSLGIRWAGENNIYVKEFPAEWNVYGRSAGPIRNTAMSIYADAAVILRVPIGQKSNGSDDMYRKMKALGKLVYREIWGDRS